MNKGLLSYVTAAVIGIGAAVALAPAQNNPAPVPPVGGGNAVTQVLVEIAAQQKQMEANLLKIEEKMAIVEEEVRQARIFARRGGGSGAQ